LERLGSNPVMRLIDGAVNAEKWAARSSLVTAGKRSTGPGRAVGQKLAGRGCKSRRAEASLMLTIIAVMASPFLQAHGQGAGEYAVKAAFLYNFAKFVEWPPEAMGSGSSPLVLGVLGDDPFGAAIDQVVAGKTANGRQLVVRRLKWGQDLKQCHILFISSSERKRLAEILGALRGASILTVGDMDQFGQQGGMIQFVIEQNRVRFEINIGAAQQGRLKLSSKLLALARNVRG
jgi:hypothetical protein